MKHNVLRKLKWAGRVDAECHQELAELFERLKKAKKGPDIDFTFFANLMDTDKGSALYWDCYNAIQSINIKDYEFHRATVQSKSQYTAVFAFECGDKEKGTYKRFSLTEEHFDSRWDSPIPKHIKRCLKQIIAGKRVKNVIMDKEALPLIRDYVDKIRARGDTNNGFIELINEYSRVGWQPSRLERVMEGCADTLSKWLTEQFIDSKEVSDKIKDIVAQIDKMRGSSTFINARITAHKEHMYERILAILKESPSLVNEVIEEAKKQMAIDLVMEA
jgi:hypothetical protein